MAEQGSRVPVSIVATLYTVQRYKEIALDTRETENNNYKRDDEASDATGLGFGPL